MKKWFLLLGAALLLVGCNRDTAIPKHEAQSNLTFEATDKKIYSINHLTYEAGETIPLMRDGKLHGYLRLMRVEKIGIEDWTNQKVVKNGVKFSYTLNFKLVLAKKEDLKITCDPSLVNENGKKVGTSCNVGWSGFATHASFANEKSAKFFEIGLQPTLKSLRSGDRLLLDIKDSNGNSFDTIIISTDVLKKAKKVNSLLTEQDVARIRSINGSEFAINFMESYSEKHPFSSDIEKNGDFCDFRYKVSFTKAPTNKIHVSSYDPYAKVLNPKFVFGLQNSFDEEILYNNNKSAVRKVFYNDDKFVPYVSGTFKPIKVGWNSKAWDNRQLQGTSVNLPEYVRMRIEFPEETAARTEKELLDFNGRFVVFQLKLKDRRLKWKAE